MSKESKKFPAVMTIKNLLGLEEGTVLQFDWASGKYVSIMEEEDIAEDYYYSGYAAAFDPYVVKDNIGTYFTYIEQNGIEDTTIEHVVTEEDVKLNPGEDLKEGDKIELSVEEAPKTVEEQLEDYPYEHPLVVDCGCGHRNFLSGIKAPGINITIVAETPTSFIELECSECGSKMKLWFATERTIEDESINEENK